MKLKKRAKEKIFETLEGFFLLVKRQIKEFNLSPEIHLVVPLERKPITEIVPTYDSDKDMTKIDFYSGNVRVKSWIVTYDSDKDFTKALST